MFSENVPSLRFKIRGVVHFSLLHWPFLPTLPYLDDGLLCGSRAVALRAIETLRQAIPWTGLSLKLEKCELHSRSDLSAFSAEMRRSNLPRFELLRLPIGDALFCERFIEDKRKGATELLTALRLFENRKSPFL